MANQLSPRLAVLALGNPLRGDDALGWLFAARLRDYLLPGLTADDEAGYEEWLSWPSGESPPTLKIRIQRCYQLQPEDSLLANEAEGVLVVDARAGGEEQWQLKRINRPENKAEAVTGPGPVQFSSHSLAPDSLPELMKTLGLPARPVWLLLLPGRQWDLGQAIHPKSEVSLNRALDHFFRQGLRDLSELLPHE